ncbi:hypothetical protein GUJ93_ZPchr0002g26318 [Zizania palustris]|uniref:Hexosyltransferase n=1 Tax=Zizania palustris TaxID=103762 RepID=A0A8J5VW19_ZIZPA|nr:hypothetical protein GUJ93_ZPchr0002g26318 [Zizania palustris]
MTFSANLSKKGYMGSYHYEKDGKYRPFSTLLPESSNSKKLYVKLVLLILMCASFLSLLNSPSIHHNDEHHTQSSAVSRGSYEPGDFGYVSSLMVDWPKISNAVRGVVREEDDGDAKVALLNFDDDEIHQWRTMLPWTVATAVHLDHVERNVTWEHLYPEWIDEEEIYGHPPTCPDLPEPAVPEEEEEFDIVAVKPASVPPRGQLVQGRAAAAPPARRGAPSRAPPRPAPAPAHVLVVSQCFPIPNLFRCKDEVARDGDVWPGAERLGFNLVYRLKRCTLYRPDVAALRQKLSLPVGSCKLAVPFKALGTYQSFNTKFWLWALTEYDRVVFLDADLLVQRPMEPLFVTPEVSATGNHGTVFNSGVMVVEPCNCTFQLLMDHIGDIDSYNGGDQGYLNEGDSEDRAAAKRVVLAADQPVVLAVHFVGMKLWFCFRDYDCNWNSAELRHFASDEAHARAVVAVARRHAAAAPGVLPAQRAAEGAAALGRRAGKGGQLLRRTLEGPRRRPSPEHLRRRAVVEREIKNRRVDGNRVTTSYAKLIANF